VLTQVPPSIRERRQQLGQADVPIPEAWETTIAALLCKAPEGRPKSAREVLRLLSLDGHSEPAGDEDEESSVLTQAGTMSGRHRREPPVQLSPAPSAEPAESEDDDAAAATVVPKHSRAVDDPALAAAIPVLHPSGSFPHDASGVHQPVANTTPPSSEDEGRQRRQILILAFLLIAAIGVIVYQLVSKHVAAP
jgi:hypothetical protein